MEIIVSCPTCKQSVVYSEKNPNRPFCSERCRLIDLGEWASEGHSIPGPSADLQLPEDED